MKHIRIISRILVGLVFMFSGFVKAVDPLGSAYKFGDYFLAFNIGFLKPFALILAIVLFTAEFISGLSVLSGYRQKTGIWGTFLLMCIFTPLTFVLALTNPVSDCGCFGDAVHLSNWQTFWKNIILLIPVLILFTGRNSIRKVTSTLREWIIISCVSIFFIIFSLLNIRYLPLIDFLPYRTGINIEEGMKVPEGKPVDEYVTTFIYEKNGVRKEFTLENYPANDSTWKFIDQKSVLVKKGFQPLIHDFSISSSDGQDLTEKILKNSGYSLLMISKKLKEADTEHLETGFELGERCLKEGIAFYIVTASGSDELSQYRNGLPFCTADETTLKTIIRSNPGYLLLRNGIIAGKWSWASVPTKERFKGDMTISQVERMNNKSMVLIVYSLSLAVIILVLLISPCFTARNRKAEKLIFVD